MGLIFHPNSNSTIRIGAVGLFVFFSKDTFVHWNLANSAQNLAQSQWLEE